MRNPLIIAAKRIPVPVADNSSMRRPPVQAVVPAPGGARRMNLSRPGTGSFGL